MVVIFTNLMSLLQEEISFYRYLYKYFCPKIYNLFGVAVGQGSWQISKAIHCFAKGTYKCGIPLGLNRI
jgi:hypothetical protein